MLQHKAPTALRKEIANLLNGVGIKNSFNEAKWLVLGALDESPSLFLTKGGEPLTPQAIQAIQEFVNRRLSREPLSRIIGIREFWSLPFRLNNHTLDPRPDSEVVVEIALSYIPKEAEFSLLDLGTGSGCLLISLLHERPQCQGIGVDLSPGATELASENAVLNQIEDRAQFKTASWGDGLPDHSFDLIISNPPYIPQSDEPSLEPEVKAYDPTLALYGGDDGLNCYRALAPEIKRLLKPGHRCVLEIGWNQREPVKAVFESGGLLFVKSVCDLGQRDRCLVFQAV